LERGITDSSNAIDSEWKLATLEVALTLEEMAEVAGDGGISSEPVSILAACLRLYHELLSIFMPMEEDREPILIGHGGVGRRNGATALGASHL
jgi:hypothetical protein